MTTPLRRSAELRMRSVSRKECTFAGVTIPTVVRAGGWWGTPRGEEGEFFRARIVEARFR